LMNDPHLYINMYAGGWGEPQLMGDEVAAETPFFTNKNVIRDRLFQWQDSIYPVITETSFYLREQLGQLYQHNKVINEVMGAAGGTEDQKKAIRAEALATRALTTFNLANYYCKPYVAATAASDPGFPIITTADVNIKSYPRGTLQETYDFIIKDLQEALQYIPMKQLSVTRMCRPAVKALLGKVYMYMGKYNEALPLLNAALADVAANGQTALYNYNEAFAPGGTFLPVDPFSGPSSPGRLPNDTKEAVLSKVFYSGSYTGNQTGNDGLVLAPWAQALYGSGDLRLLLYTDKNPDFSTNAGGRLRKYGVTYSRYGLQLSDLYLLAAECKARLNDLAGAVAEVETLRKNRMPVTDATVPPAIAGNRNALIRFIIDERVREFAGEGYRWFDMRRLSIDPIFAPMNFTHTMYNADGSTTVFSLKQPSRLVLKFPRNFTEANPDMADNP
jgi:starch-binding outer membrane protein, SusD/RagB family